MPLTLPIEPGKRYVRRDGVVVEVRASAGSTTALVATRDASRRGGVYVNRGTGHHWREGTPHAFDIVADADTGCAHAELMAEYAKDAAAHPKPWTLWEYAAPDHPVWCNCAEHPEWHPTMQYRRKPTPSHLVAPPPHGQSVRFVGPTGGAGFFFWTGTDLEITYLNAGLLYAHE